MLEYFLQDYNYYTSIGQFLIQLVDSKHADEYNLGIEAIRSINYDEPNEDDIKDAIKHFSRINEEDKDYVKCFAWFHLTICYLLLFRFDKCYYYLNNINSIEITFFTLHKDDIKSVQGMVNELKNLVNETKKEWEEEHGGPAPHTRLPAWATIVIIVLSISVVGLIIGLLNI